MDDERLEGVEAGLFYVVTRHRNAWNGNPSRQYKGPTSLTSTRRNAMLVAEEWRAAGSSFRIQQVPGVVLLARSRPIVMVEFHSDNSFGGLRIDALALRYQGRVFDAVTAMGPTGRWHRHLRPSPNSFVIATFSDEGEVEVEYHLDQINLLEHTFLQWYSESVGGGEPLQWRREAGRHVADGVVDVFVSFSV